MSAPLVQRLLRDGMTATELCERHGVVMKPAHNGKHSLVYGIGASDSDQVAQECRGLILRERTYDLVAYPFDRFFNHGQDAAANIDWGTAAFQEKLDGSLIIVYFDGGEWHAATRGTCEGHVEGIFGDSFRKLTERAIRDMGHESLRSLMTGAPEHTYMFELTAPENQVVCAYHERRLTLIGVRSMVTLKELDPAEFASSLGVPTPREWRFSSLDELVEVIRDWDPRDFEGVVVRDAHFNRIKVKSPKYLAIHHATDSLGSSWRSLVEAVAKGTTDDIEGQLPQFVLGRVQEAKRRIAQLCAETVADFAELRVLETQKEFALSATKRRWPGALFALRAGKVSCVEEFVGKVQPSALTDLLGFEVAS